MHNNIETRLEQHRIARHERLIRERKMLERNMGDWSASRRFRKERNRRDNRWLYEVIEMAPWTPFNSIMCAWLKEGMIRVSELSHERLERLRDVYARMGGQNAFFFQSHHYALRPGDEEYNKAIDEFDQMLMRLDIF